MNAHSAHPPCTTRWRGETVHLLPQHAVWWPAGATLLVADVHLGKAATYRQLGQPVPAGTTQANLDGLSQLLATHPAHQLVFLGDFLHAASSRTASLLQALTQWRAQHAAVDITLVRGNHDDRAGDPPPELNITVVDEPWLLGPFACCHHPQSHPTHFVLAGHVHPVRHLSGPGRDRLRLPCFVSDDAHAILPAYGAFTGGQALQALPGQEWHAVGGGRVWRLP